jgi:MFS transporter, DHA2 family, methylenomycin A resistance protein
MDVIEKIGEAGEPTFSDQGGEAPKASDRGRSLTLFAACLGFAVVQLDVSVVNVAIKPIGEELGGGIGGLQWVISAYTIAFAALILTAGALGDRIGAKRVFVAGFLVFTAASALCGLAPSLAILIAARVVQGVGAAILVPCSLTLLNHTFSDPGERAHAVGLWAAGAAAALAGGPLVGGLLIASLGWRAIFFINAPIGALGILITLRRAPETSRSGGSVDVAGQLTAVLALAVLAGATIEGGSRGFADPAVLAGFAFAIFAGAAFLVIESRRRHPMLPLGLFRSATFSAATAIGLLINIVFYGLIFVFSLYFQRQQGYSAIETGLAFAPTTAAVMAGNLLAGRTASKFSPRAVLGTGALLMGISLAALLGIGSGSSYVALAAQLTALGFGLGLIVPVMTSSLLGSVEAERSGVASGTLNTARQAGSVIGVALFGSLIGSDPVFSLHIALAVSVALAAIVALLSLRVE